MALGKLKEDEAALGEASIFAEINITPLTDIFLVLLIIFMVSSSVMVEQAVESASRTGVKVNLPKGTTREIDPGARSLVVSVLQSGEILVQSTKVAESDLEKLFTSTAAKDAATQVIIEADEGVKHGQVVRIMNLAKQSGLSKLAIATKASR